MEEGAAVTAYRTTDPLENVLLRCASRRDRLRLVFVGPFPPPIAHIHAGSA